MDFADIGARCSEPTCRQYDFLPFTCDMCSKNFCLSHRMYTSHACPNSGTKDCRVISCPLCKKTIPLIATEDPNDTWERHATTDCDPTAVKHKRKQRCAQAGCRETLTTANKTTCSRCLQDVCLRHRFEADHSCTGVVAAAMGGGQSGATAADRQRREAFLRSVESGPKPSPAPAPRAAPSPARPSPVTAPRPAPAPVSAPTASSGREVCSVCGKSFDSIAALITHADAAHSTTGDRTAEPTSPGAGPEACPNCGKRFTDVALLISHVETAHKQGDKGSCAVC